jgi:hypothetical protein
MMWNRRFSLLVHVFIVVCSILAIGQSSAWKPGDMLVYEIVSNTHISGGHLPSQAYASHPAQFRVIKINITGLDTDGAALIHVKIDTPFPQDQFHVPAAVMAGARKSYEDQNRYREFDARLSRDGALIVAADNAPGDNVAPKPESMSQAELAHYRDTIVEEVNSPAYQANLAKNDAAGTFQIPNVVALSCAKKTAFTAGDTWHVVSKSDAANYDIVVEGKQPYHGHNTVVLNVKSNTDNPNGSTETAATVYYDPQSKLVIGMHIVITSNIRVTGMTSTSTSDVNLK